MPVAPLSVNDAKGVDMLTKYKELYDAGALDRQALTATPESTGKKFLTGAVAMNPGSAFDLGNFKKQAPNLYENIGITDQITSTGHVNMYVMGVMVNANTSKKPAAIAFAYDGVLERTAALGWGPDAASPWIDGDWRNDPRYDDPPGGCVIDG